MSQHPTGPLTCVVCGAAFTGGLHPPARFCLVCRPRQRRPKPAKYVWTPERDAILRARYDGTVRNRSTEIARELGWPGWAIKKRAAHLGLTRAWPTTRRDWTDGERAFLAQWSGHRDSGWIAKQLRRTLTSVVVQQKRSDLARRVRAGYTLRDLCGCFGVDHHVVERWGAAGLLPRTTRLTARTDKQGDPWSIPEAAVVAFVRACPQEVDLRKVDQAWFFDVIVGATLEATSTGASGRHDDLRRVRAVFRELEADEAISTQAIHARVPLPAHEIRLALRSLQAAGEITRVWQRAEPAVQRRTA
ncbi:MAG TPA: hypothetical protein DCQ64_19900 [Candidatus Rokubacteria bacterium]|nr:hypothetical protein [Candidatus Rokubacteria bacterium]